MRISTSMLSQSGIASILNQQAKLEKTQNQLSTGKQILTPADDPAGQVRLQNLAEGINTNQQYQDNISTLTARLSTEDATLAGVTEVLQRVRELMVQGVNATQTAETRRGTAAEIEQLLGEVLGLANKQGANGEYIFAGNVVGSAPYSEDPLNPGQYLYHGDEGTRNIRISETRLIADGDHGPTIFGPYASRTTTPASLGLANLNFNTQVLGGAPVSNFQFNVTDDTLLAPGFQVDVSGQDFANSDAGGVAYAAAVESQLTGAGSNTKVRYVVDNPGVSGHLVFTSGEGGASSVAPTISAIGVGAEIDAGTVTQDSTFNVLERFIVDMNSNTPNSSIITDLDRALEGLLDARASVGARLNSVERQEVVNADFLLDMKSAKSAAEDLDYAEAISRFNLETVGLQAAQQAYVKVQGLSLFNFL